MYYHSGNKASGLCSQGGATVCLQSSTSNFQHYYYFRMLLYRVGEPHFGKFGHQLDRNDTTTLQKRSVKQRLRCFAKLVWVLNGPRRERELWLAVHLWLNWCWAAEIVYKLGDPSANNHVKINLRNMNAPCN